MKQLALQRISELSAYKPPLFGRSDGTELPLDFNERTVPPSDAIKQAVMDFATNSRIEMYPDYLDLERDIANYAGLTPDEVLITNGSDHGVDIILRTFSEKGDKVIIPSPSFVMFKHFAQIAGSEIVSPQYELPNMAFPLQSVLDQIDDGTRMVVICNPNNPTGTLVELDDIAKVAQKARNAIVYVDEAYFEFSNLTAVPLLGEYPNIVITRTFSKAFGLASMRIGYCLAHKELIGEMVKVRGPYAVNLLAYDLARVALKFKHQMTDYAEDVMRSAKPLVESFFDEIGVTYFKSAANFILIQPKNATNVADKLMKNGVMVRPRSDVNIEDTVRVTIGTTEQMKKFIEIYREAVL